MGYSLDNSANTTIVVSTSMNASVTAPSGAHTLHVKSWGNRGASCVTDVAITVTGGPAPVVSSEAVNVTGPSNGANVTSPFTLTASAPSCGENQTSAMGYSFDGSMSRHGERAAVRAIPMSSLASPPRRTLPSFPPAPSASARFRP
jgi:hypothetical protein